MHYTALHTNLELQPSETYKQEKILQIFKLFAFSQKKCIVISRTPSDRINLTKLNQNEKQKTLSTASLFKTFVWYKLILHYFSDVTAASRHNAMQVELSTVATLHL